MKIPVLKALANPARIFFVPYNLAVFNFAILLLIYMTVFVSGLILSGGDVAINPLYFLLTLIAIHSILAMISKKEPFLLRIFMARFALFKKKIPNRLIA
ncbi:MAG: VirB3 family type IV secretion system protein [Rickettsiales bacterium]|jgi:type IV secretory pathway VirB3-like protein|nr:VirB3 family type IV secretion system protein [Rickettsiales bacterium]